MGTDGSMVVRHEPAAGVAFHDPGGNDHAAAAGEGERTDRAGPDRARVPRSAVSWSYAIERSVATALSGSTTAAMPAVTKPFGPSSQTAPPVPRWSSRSCGYR